jgi:hypothetical protein
MSAAKTQPREPETPAVVTMRGTDSTGARIFLVPSASGSLAAHATVYHAVVLEEVRLRCNCPAATFGRVCAHQRAVTAHLLEQTRLAAERALAAQRCQPHESAPPARSNAPFSIWKQ